VYTGLSSCIYRSLLACVFHSFNTNTPHYQKTGQTVAYCTYSSRFVSIRPTQSMICVQFLVARFREWFNSSFSPDFGNYLTHRSVQMYKSCVQDQMFRDLTLSTRLCSTSIITQHGWVIPFLLTKIVRRKWFVPVRYQLPKGKSVGLALKSFCMIQRVERYRSLLACVFHFFNRNMPHYPTTGKPVKYCIYRSLIECM